MLRERGDMERMSVGDHVSEAAQAGWLEPKWYVLFVRSNQEKRVAQHLEYRAIEHFLPVFESVRQWRDRKVKLQSPLFPGYVFVRLAMTERLKALVVPNVVDLVGTRNVPTAIADQEIDWIRRGVGHGKAQPHPYLRAGIRVVIKAGAMAGMEGILLRTQNST
ncbi:MAG TPA: UpxY family transcription antiterminator, partial [Candidatus Angelobacter sp.]